MAKLTATTFAGLDSVLGNRHRRVIGNNTTAERGEDGTIVVRLHGHRIATMTADVTTLTDAGWWTVTTRDRLNSLAPGGVRVFSDRGACKVRTLGGDVQEWKGSLSVFARSGCPVI